MSSFSDLLRKDSAAEQEAVEARKTDPFTSLGKAVAKASAPVDAATASEGVSASPPGSAKTPSVSFSFLGSGKEKTSSDVTEPENSGNSVSASLATEDVTSPDDTMQGISGEIFSETKAAKEFQSEDQPEEYSQEIVDNLKQSLGILVDSIDNKELIADALKKIMLDLKRHRFLVGILHPEDCQLMVRAIRESYGVTLAKKQTRSTKRATTSKEVEDALDVLADVEINI